MVLSPVNLVLASIVNVGYLRIEEESSLSFMPHIQGSHKYTIAGTSLSTSRRVSQNPLLPAATI